VRGGVLRYVIVEEVGAPSACGIWAKVQDLVAPKPFQSRWSLLLLVLLLSLLSGFACAGSGTRVSPTR
jgi:hypothetical protein